MDNQNFFDVVIVGGGIAGLGAAYQLNKHQQISWILLEANDKIGGRLQSIYFNGKRVDTGGYQLASYGQKKANNNELYQLIKQGFCKIKHRQGTGKNYYYNENGTLCSEESLNKVWKTFQKFENQSESLSQKNKSLSVKQCLDIFVSKGGLKNLNEDQLKIFNLEIHSLEQQQSGQIQKLSADFMFGQFEAQQDNLDDYPIPVDTYHGITEQLAKCLKQNNIRLNRNVRSIEKLQNEVLITCEIVNQQQNAQFQTIRCKYVICATPLSVLKNNTINFKPSLPKQHIKAIQSIGFGLMEKIFLAFQQPFWKKDTLGLMIATTNKANFPYFTNLSGPIKDKQQMSYILCGFATQSQVLNFLQKHTKEEIVQDAVNTLKKAFPDKQIKVIDAYITNWTNQKYIGGAYSYLTPKCTYKEALELKKAVNNYLWFAGEYLYFQNHGCAHGAFATGNRSAKQIIKLINN